MLKCANCKKEFEDKTIINGETIWLKSRKFCLECSPIGGGNHRTYIINIPDGMAYCIRCKTIKSMDEFYHRRNGDPLSYCATCQKEVKLLKMKENLERVIEERGGSCADCLNIYPLNVFDFYKDGKTYQLSKIRNMSLEKIHEELESYKMLCKNCCAIRDWQKGL